MCVFLLVMCVFLHPCITNLLSMCLHVRVRVHICACVSVCVCSCVCVCACVNINVYFWERGGTGESMGAHGSTSIVEVTKPKRIAKVKQPVKKSTFACVCASVCLGLCVRVCPSKRVHSPVCVPVSV